MEGSIKAMALVRLYVRPAQGARRSRLAYILTGKRIKSSLA